MCFVKKVFVNLCRLRSSISLFWNLSGKGEKTLKEIVGLLYGSIVESNMALFPYFSLLVRTLFGNWYYFLLWIWNRG